MMDLTHALTRPELAVAAALALRPLSGPAKVDGLVTLLADPPTSRAGTAAIEALENCAGPVVEGALRAALGSPHVLVRMAAIDDLYRRNAPDVAGFVRILTNDTSWITRRRALEALASLPGPERWHILAAADDPHWRVRHALVKKLLAWGESDPARTELIQKLSAASSSLPPKGGGSGWGGGAPAADSSPPSPTLPPWGGGSQSDRRVEGVRLYLRWRWHGVRPPEPIWEPDDPRRFCPFWDWDAAVLARNLDRMGEAARVQSLDLMPFLLGHDDPRVRSWAADVLRTRATVRHWAEVLALLDEPRREATESVEKLLGQMNLDQREEVARHILHLEKPSPSQLPWALAQVGTAFPAEEEAEAVARWLQPNPPGPPSLKGRGEQEAGSSSPLPFREGGPGGLGQGDHPHARAAALTPEQARELVADPSRETSWYVLARAARLAKTPLWKLEPDPPWQPPKRTPQEPPTLSVTAGNIFSPRPLGPHKFPVSPVGLSGHYGLPIEGFVRGADLGVNLFFWEPNYATMTDFVTQLTPSARNRFHFIAGTFEAEGKKVEKDVDRALRALKLDRLTVFLVFWVQTWDRITPDVRETLEWLKETGKIASFALSTHNRTLAVEAMDRGWNPVMVRHSAAHRGAEAHIFPHAVEKGVSLITFNNTCYGRLLKPHGDSQPPSAADCYRYTLSQPGVVTCWTAPSTVEQLEHNLTAMLDSAFPPEERDALLRHGARVYEEDTIFRKLIRAR